MPVATAMATTLATLTMAHSQRARAARCIVFIYLYCAFVFSVLICGFLCAILIKMQITMMCLCTFVYDVFLTFISGVLRVN